MNFPDQTCWNGDHLNNESVPHIGLSVKVFFFNFFFMSVKLVIIFFKLKFINFGQNVSRDMM